MSIRSIGLVALNERPDFVRRDQTHLGISKRGDAYLRTLLMRAARSVVLQSHEASTRPWLQTLLKRRPYNVVVTAVANKLALKSAKN